MRVVPLTKGFVTFVSSFYYRHKSRDLNLSIPPVPAVVQRWRKRGITVSDANTTEYTEIWFLIGDDYANQFLKE